MLCVEAGHVSAPVILLPGTAFEASQILQVSCKIKIFLNYMKISEIRNMKDMRLQHIFLT